MASKSPEDVVDEAMRTLLTDARLSSSAVVHHTLDCLSYLVAAERLEVRFVLMRQGMYHKKLWLFSDGTHWAAVHGSGNATARGLLVNGEQMTVDKPWSDGACVGAARRAACRTVGEAVGQRESPLDHAPSRTGPGLGWRLRARQHGPDGG